MDQNQNNDLFDSDNPTPQQPQQPADPTQMGGGAQVYQAPPSYTPAEPRPYMPPPGMGQPPVPPKKSNTGMIIAIVVVVLLCCCCLGILAAGYFYGDTLLQDYDFSFVAPALAAFI